MGEEKNHSEVLGLCPLSKYWGLFWNAQQGDSKFRNDAKLLDRKTGFKNAK